MATLTVWRFDTVDGAGRASQILQGLARENLLVLHDAAAVEWERGKSTPRTRQLTSTTTVGALGSGFWGLLFGLTFFVPLLGAATGAVSGALTGSLADVGIDDRFINRIRDQVTPGTSALFVMTADAVVESVHEAFAAGPTAELISTHLTAQQEAALREVFAD